MNAVAGTSEDAKRLLIVLAFEDMPRKVSPAILPTGSQILVSWISMVSLCCSTIRYLLLDLTENLQSFKNVFLQGNGPNCLI